MHTAIKIITISSLALTIAACGSVKDANKSNFSNAIQAYLDTQNGLCATIPGEGFPFTVSDQDIFGSRNKKSADALADAGLLTKRDTEVKSSMFGAEMVPATEYQITDFGKKFLVTNGANTLGQHDAFCTGKYTVVEVDNFTEPSDIMGVKLSQVNYRYKVVGADDWAKSEGVRANYKNFAQETQGDIQGKAAVILTNEGWMHERLFKRG
uniref:hypothetical protein n=1 Tax=Castellaniella defragrans TaxID=75697 RepID=UPI003341EAD1